MDESLRDTFLEVMEESLNAQLKAVQRLRGASGSERTGRVSSKDLDESPNKSMSQIDMAATILSSGEPRHVTEIIAAIRERFQTEVDRESLVSAISKRVVRNDRFRRTDKNTFALLNPPTP